MAPPVTWTEDHDERIAAGIRAGLKAEQIAEDFPDRTVAAVVARYYRVRGRIRFEDAQAAEARRLALAQVHTSPKVSVRPLRPGARPIFDLVAIRRDRAPRFIEPPRQRPVSTLDPYAAEYAQYLRGVQA